VGGSSGRVFRRRIVRCIPRRNRRPRAPCHPSVPSPIIVSGTGETKTDRNPPPANDAQQDGRSENRSSDIRRRNYVRKPDAGRRRSIDGKHLLEGVTDRPPATSPRRSSRPGSIYDNDLRVFIFSAARRDRINNDETR